MTSLCKHTDEKDKKKKQKDTCKAFPVTRN